MVITAHFEAKGMDSGFQNYLSTIAETSTNLSADEMKMLKKEIVHIRVRLLDGINNAIFSTMDEPTLLRHMGHLQRECVFLRDVLHGYTHIRPDYLPLTDAADDILGTTLNYISGYNGKYFDQDNRIPESQRLILLDDLKKDGLLLGSKLKSRSVTGKLADLLQNSLRHLESEESLSYRLVSYMKQVVSELIGLLSLGRSRNWERKLAVKLIALNFNEDGFFKYCIGVIAKAVDEEKTKRKQVQLFGWYGKEIKKMAVEGESGGYSRVRPGIVALIGAYIASELEFLKDDQQQGKDTFKERAGNYRFKLKMNMPIGALALHVQLFIGIELIASEIKKHEINQFMADNYSTIGTDSFTANSFDKKRTELDEASYRIVDKHLVDMRAYLKSRFEGE